MKKLQVDLLKDHPLKALIIFAIPILLSNVFQQLYNTVDTMIVGNYLGEMSLAAIGASTAVFNLIIAFTFGLGLGMTIVVARCFGTGDKDLLKQSVATSIVIGVGAIVIVMTVSFFFLRDVLVWLRTPDDIIDEAYAYIAIIVSFISVMFMYNICAGLFRAVGNSVVPLVFLIISSVLNIVLDLVFIVYMKMGIEGVAIATVIAQTVSVVLSLLYMKFKLQLLIPSIKHFKFDKTMYKEMLGQGMSMAMMFSLVVFGSFILQYAINDMGVLIIAGHTTARRVNSFFMMPISTFSGAVSTYVSQNKGADNRERIIKGIKYAILVQVVCSVVIIIMVYITSDPIIRLVSGSNEAVVIDTGRRYLLWNSPFFIILGVLFVLRYSLQGLGEKLIPLVSSVMELVMKIAFVVLIIPAIGYFGVILSEPIIWVFMTIQLAWAYKNNRYLFG